MVWTQHFLQLLQQKMSWIKQFTTSSQISSDKKLRDSRSLTMSPTTAIGTSVQWDPDSTTTVGTMPTNGLLNKTRMKSIQTVLRSSHGGTMDSKHWRLGNTHQFPTTSSLVFQQLETCSLLSQSLISSQCSFGNLVKATFPTTAHGLVSLTSPTVTPTSWQTTSLLTNMTCLNRLTSTLTWTHSRNSSSRTVSRFSKQTATS